MRILILSQFYPPLMGGIERHVQTLSQVLTRHGHHVAIVTLWHYGLAEFETLEGGINIYRVRGTMQRMTRLFTSERHHAPPFPDPEVVLALRKILAIEKPHIVHGHDWMVRSFLPLKGASQAKLVRTLHDCGLSCAQLRYMYMDQALCPGPSIKRCTNCVVHHYGPVKGLVTLSLNWVMSEVEKRSTDSYLPVSQAVGRVNRLDNRPAQVLHNFVADSSDVDDCEADPRLALLPDRPFILQVGDLAADKGINVLFEAYAGLQSPPPLVLIGRRLDTSPKRLPPGVTVIDGWPHSLVMRAWQRSLFGTVPSTCLDAFPTVTLEAMLCGRAVIGSRIGGIADQVIDGQTGFLVPPGDAAALRGAMEALISNPSLCEQMGQAGRERVQEFQADSVVKKIEAVYETLWHR